MDSPHLSPGVLGCHRPEPDGDGRPCGYAENADDPACDGCARSPRERVDLAAVLSEVQGTWAARWGVA